MSIVAGAAIFDLDGVLIRTADLHTRSWGAAAASCGITVPRGMTFRGVAAPEAARRLLASAGMQREPSATDLMHLVELKSAMFKAAVRAAGAAICVPRATSILLALRSRRARVGVASASRNAGWLLQHAGLSPYVDCVSDGHFAGRPKPDPGQLLDVAVRLGTRPGACLVFEDAEVGVTAAMRAGMRCVGVGPETADLKGLELHINDLEELDLVELDSLLERNMHRIG